MQMPKVCRCKIDGLNQEQRIEISEVNSVVLVPALTKPSICVRSVASSLLFQGQELSVVVTLLGRARTLLDKHSCPSVLKLPLQDG